MRFSSVGRSYVVTAEHRLIGLALIAGSILHPYCPSELLMTPFFVSWTSTFEQALDLSSSSSCLADSDESLRFLGECLMNALATPSLSGTISSDKAPSGDLMRMMSTFEIGRPSDTPSKSLSTPSSEEVESHLEILCAVRHRFQTVQGALNPADDHLALRGGLLPEHLDLSEQLVSAFPGHDLLGLRQLVAPREELKAVFLRDRK